jgi:glycosyltransferase involved in cell wall biosynthesis
MTIEPTTPSLDVQQDLLSVVVIGRNEGERLRRCLASLDGMNRQNFAVEVIYVDSGSTDGSVSMAQGAGAQTISLVPERPSAALGRNAGWRAAQGSFILFLDGDTILHPDFVAKALPSFAEPTTAVVWGHRREIHPDQSLYNRVLDLDWIYQPGWSAFCGGDALFRRDVLVQTDGFDATLIAGEEPELCRRILGLGYKILHIDQAMTGHDLAIFKWSQYWKRATRAGHAFAEVSDRFRATENPFWSDASQGNQRRALMLMAISLTGFAASVYLKTIFPLILSCAILSTLFLRSAWKARWKSDDKFSVLLYGVHSHLQQIPIFVGQLHYRWNKRKGKRTALLDYK